MNSKWTVFRSRYIPAIWPIVTYWSWPVKTVLGMEQGTILNVWNKGNFTGYREAVAAEKMGATALKLLKKNVAKLEEMRLTGAKAGKEAVQFTKKFAQKAKTASLEDFAKFFDSFTPVYQNVIKKSMVYWLYAADPLEAAIKKHLAQYSEANATEIFATMSLPVTKSYSALEEAEFESVVELVHRNGMASSEVKKKIADFSAKYFWFPYEYIGSDIWNEETVTKRVAESLEKPVVQRAAVDISEMQRACISKYNLPNRLVELFKILQAITLMQDDRKMYQAETCYYLNQEIMTELAKRLQVTLQQARYIDASLLRQYIASKNADELAAHLQSREKLFLVVETDYGVWSYDGNGALHYLKKQGIAIDADLVEVKELKGQVANRGYAKGKVKLLLTSSGNVDFQEGDVLVTGMTTPDFVPFVKKAAAIITDEGGVTSHAAIVSRELNKPCIIGTKIATKWLKNGDLVEVDAEKGVVKKL